MSEEVRAALITGSYLLFSLAIGTVLGWVVKHQSQAALNQQNADLQKELQSTKRQLALELQKREHIGKARQADLQQINEWWREGWDLANQFASLNEEVNKNKRYYGKYVQWKNNYNRRMAVAAQMDQMRFGGENVYDNEDLNDWYSSRKVPTKLTSLLSAMSDLLADFVMEAEDKTGVHDVHVLHDKLEKLYAGGTATMQRIELNQFETKSAPGAA